MVLRIEDLVRLRVELVKAEGWGLGEAEEWVWVRQRGGVWVKLMGGKMMT